MSLRPEPPPPLPIYRHKEAGGVETIGMACMSETCEFMPMRFQRRVVGANDILIDMKFCGVCHSDVVWASGDAGAVMGYPRYPAVPGHEAAGVCTEVGPNVTKIKVGDHVGVGCMVDSCRTCAPCRRGDENWCKGKFTSTYGGWGYRHGHAASFPTGEQTKGGYTNKMVVDEHFAVLIPQSYPLEKAGPIMCAGITMYEPLVNHGAGAGTRVAFVGLGGLGLIGIKIAKALGCHVVGISRGEAKRPMALSAGADGYIASSSEEQLLANGETLDLIINTIPIHHDYGVYSALLNGSGRQVMIGVTAAFTAAYVVDQAMCGKCTVTYSGIGGIAHTQEVMNLVDRHQIYPETKVVPVNELNRVFELQSSGNDAGLRYVLDIAGSMTEELLGIVGPGTPLMSTICEPAPKLEVGGTSLSIFSIVGAIFGLIGHETCCRRRAPPNAASPATQPLVTQS